MELGEGGKISEFMDSPKVEQLLDLQLAQQVDPKVEWLDRQLGEQVDLEMKEEMQASNCEGNRHRRKHLSRGDIGELPPNDLLAKHAEDLEKVRFICFLLCSLLKTIYGVITKEYYGKLAYTFYFSEMNSNV